MAEIISIRDEVYRKLLAIKLEEESFSELFDRIAEGARACGYKGILRVGQSRDIKISLRV